MIIGVSYDSPTNMKLFKEKYKLPFMFISDKDKSISKHYNANGWFFPKRKTIVINPEGLIEYIFDNVKINNHTNQILDVINSKK